MYTNHLVTTSWDLEPAAIWNFRAYRLDELAQPYYVLTQNVFDITLASAEGGEIPVDPASLEALSEDAKLFSHDGILSNTLEINFQSLFSCVPSYVVFSDSSHAVLLHGMSYQYSKA